MIESRDESQHINSVPSNDVRDSRVIEDVYIFSTNTSIVENPLVNSDTQIIDEIHEFSESTSGDVDVQVESNTPIPTDVHTHDNGTSDAECEPVVESTVTTFNYSFWSVFGVLYYDSPDFSSFSGCLKICLESSVPLTKSIALLPRHPMYSLSLSLGVIPKVSTVLHFLVAFDDITRQLANCNDNYKFLHVHIVYCRN